MPPKVDPELEALRREKKEMAANIKTDEYKARMKRVCFPAPQSVKKT